MSRAAGQLLKRVLMVPPKHFRVEYKINPWMGGVVDRKNAYKQWSTFKSAIEKQGIQVFVMEPSPKLPDQVFVCNTGLVYNNRVYLSKFRHKQRTGEQRFILDWFNALGLRIYGDDYAEFFEGGGDATFSDPDTLWAGFGPRSSKAVYDRIKEMGNFDIVRCELINPKFYHFNMCFCAVDESTALWYPPAFSEATGREIMRRLPNSIAVSEEEANAMVCNAISIRSTVISPLGMLPATREALSKRRMAVTEVDMSEFMKSGGATQCLVLRL